MSDEAIPLPETEITAPEEIFAVSRRTLFSYVPVFSGFLPMTAELALGLDQAALAGQWLVRDEIEQDPRYKQFIPYCTLYHPPTKGVFIYQRGGGVTEQRLAGKKSCGIGGHVNPPDGVLVGSDVLTAGLNREITEEVIGVPAFEGKPIPYGLINDDSTTVGQVHLGLAYVQAVPDPEEVMMAEEDLTAVGFVPIQDLLNEMANEPEAFELWTLLAVTGLAQTCKLI